MRALHHHSSDICHRVDISPLHLKMLLKFSIFTFVCILVALKCEVESSSLRWHTTNQTIWNLNWVNFTNYYIIIKVYVFKSIIRMKLLRKKPAFQSIGQVVNSLHFTWHRYSKFHHHSSSYPTPRNPSAISLVNVADVIFTLNE